MQTAAHSAPWRRTLTELQRRQRLIVLPTVICTVLALAYAVGRPDTWRAAQTLLVRDETGGNLGRQGRFDSAEAMKTAQETVVEIARSTAVAEAALLAIGPPPRRRSPGRWPSRAEVEQAQRGLVVAPPKGTEFGKTEMLYLTVTEQNGARAVALARAACDQLEARLQELRNAKAQSIMAELQKSVHVAQADLTVPTRQLEAMEREVGSDLGELRILNDSGAGESNLRSALNQIKHELRQVRTAHDANVQRLAQLSQAQQEPGRLLAAPAQLLEVQPALRRLKDGLVDAGLRTAQLRGKMSADHPEVQAAVAAEQEVRTQLQQELDLVVQGLQADLSVSAAQLQSLQVQLADVDRRLNRLAGLRARYGNLAAEVRQRTENLVKAQRELADARAREAATQSTSLITRLDQPDLDDAPVGPGRATIVLAGCTGGSLLGLGLAFLTLPAAARGRRWGDYLPFGRRADDAASRAAQVPGERRAPAIPPGARAAREPLAATE